MPSKQLTSSGGSGFERNSRLTLFMQALLDAELLQHTKLDALLAASSASPSEDWKTRALDTLQAYYKMGHEDRRLEDGFLVVDTSTELSSAELLETISNRAPELKDVRLEYLGSPVDPTYVLRLGPHRGPILDDDDPIDGRVPGHVTTRGIIAASNTLLSCVNVRRRFVPLRMDVDREPFISTTINHALNLCQGDHLEESDIEALLAFAQW